MRLASPPGVRSCRDGGTWEIARDARGAQCLYDDLADLARLTERLPESAKVSLIEDMRTKMKRAERGALEFGTGRQFDVDLIESSRITLEIRLIDHEIPDPSGTSD